MHYRTFTGVYMQELLSTEISLKGEYLSVLSVLEKMQYCIDNGIDVYDGVVLHSGMGICWHVLVYTPEPEITALYLSTVFVAMGLDSDYPVESQIKGAYSPAYIFTHTRDLYCTSTKQGELRVKLLADLIEYFKKRV